jgi:hypothetical protein
MSKAFEFPSFGDGDPARYAIAWVVRRKRNRKAYQKEIEHA